MIFLKLNLLCSKNCLLFCNLPFFWVQILVCFFLNVIIFFFIWGRGTRLYWVTFILRPEDEKELAIEGLGKGVPGQVNSM